jgi:hypothetical protein
MTPTGGSSPNETGVVTVNGQPFSHALTYKSSDVGRKTSWELGGRYRRFSAVVGVDHPELSDNKTLFEVLVDGRTVISTEAKPGQNVPVSSAHLAGGQVIELKMRFVKTFSGIATWHWGDPKVSP